MKTQPKFEKNIEKFKSFLQKEFVRNQIFKVIFLIIFSVLLLPAIFVVGYFLSFATILLLPLSFLALMVHTRNRGTKQIYKSNVKEIKLISVEDHLDAANYCSA